MSDVFITTGLFLLLVLERSLNWAFGKIGPSSVTIRCAALSHLISVGVRVALDL